MSKSHEGRAKLELWVAWKGDKTFGSWARQMLLEMVNEKDACLLNDGKKKRR
jgi:hypothetical protein